MIRESINNFDCEFNKTAIIKMMIEDNFGELNWEDLRANLNRINRECVDGANQT